ncbi:C3HC zinc finger-like-domain-containing protein [Butyriboletus roseoflavus]|nr:C3HC zinc finger-like-domain-containing protein [Butyriboletus roseoflavus]
MQPNTSSSISSVRTTKRKLEDAIRTLDGAVVPPSLASAIERPTPSKRPCLTRSVYSTLAKFNATSKERLQPSSKTTPTIDVSKSAPHLAAILARSTSRSKEAPPLNHLSTPPAHSASEYRPSSTDSFLSRLATYKITTYANKPPQIDAVTAARCGWINDGQDRLVCGMCDVSWVLAGREGMKKDAASALVEKQRVSLVEMHKDGCPWKARQCDPSVYRVPLQAPTAMVRELKATALSLEPVVANVAVKHPLSPTQLSSLHSIFSAAASERWVSEHNSAMDVDETTHPIVPSDTAIVVALFGWGPAPTATRSELRCRSSLSISRAGSYGPSASMPPTPSLSRTSSFSSHFRGRASTPTPSASPRMSISEFSISPGRVGASSRIKNPWSNTTTVTVPRDVSLVYCVLCQRRVGLWGYSRNDTTPLVQDQDSPSASREHQKEFDLVKEHRSYCPYIVCSSVVPSFSHSPALDPLGNATEGWRAVLTVVQRHDLSQRQRISRFLSSDDPDSQASSAELKGVDAMVAAVKNNGVSTEHPFFERH